MRNATWVNCVLAIGIALAGWGAMPGRASTLASDGTVNWRIAYWATVPEDNSMIDIVATGRDHAWAVGETRPTKSGKYGYSAYWNGVRWQITNLPRGFQPYHVYASAEANAWISGHKYSSAGTSRWAGLRWNGAGWQQMPMPDLYGGHIVLATGTVGAWALGSGSSLGRSAYWNGVSWQDRPFPRIGPNPTLVALSRTDLWAMGATPGSGRLIAYRWIGPGWREVRMAHPPIYRGVVEAAAASPHSVWIQTITNRRTQPRTLHAIFWHWNGTALSLLPRPEIVGPGISADRHGGAWFGAAAHWTGRRFRYPHRATRCRSSTGWDGVVAAIPGTGSAWSTDSCLVSKEHGDGVIEMTGALPP